MERERRVAYPMGRQGLTRRGLMASLAAAPSNPLWHSTDARTWKELVRDLEVAHERRAITMRRLFEAERRYFTLPSRQRIGPEPDWFLAAQQAEAEATAVVETITLQIARTPSSDQEGLALKVRLLATAFGEVPDRMVGNPPDPDDLVACLLRSLILDLG